MRYWTVFLMACTGDKGITTFNSTPEISITSHPDDTLLQPDENIRLIASVSDLNHSATDLRVEWKADEEVLCSATAEISGDTICETLIPLDTEIVSAVVQDPMGATGADQIAVRFANQPPQVFILSHTSGATFQDGVPVTFQGQAEDAEDESDALMATWYADGNAICDATYLTPAGESACTFSPNSDTSHIRLVVVDSEGDAGEASITVSVAPTVAPTIEIVSPLDGSVYSTDDMINFTANVSDEDSSMDEISLSWSSDLEGVFLSNLSPSAQGTSTEEAMLGVGMHNIQLTAIDAQQNQSQSSVTVEVRPANTAPSCQINYPTNNDALGQSETIVFEATVSDAESNPNLLSVSWSSNLDGLIGVSQPTNNGEVLYPYSHLSSGTHLVSLEVVDPGGLACVDQVLLKVSSPPVIAWSSPSTGSVIPENGAFFWNATVSDLEDLSTQLTAEWSSSIDGVFSTQGPDSSGLIAFQSSLSVGTHTVSLTITDTDGMATTEQRTMLVDGFPTAPTVSILPNPAYTADALVATALGAIDPEGNLVTYEYAWEKNGSLTSFQTNTVPGTEVHKGEIWTAIVTPSDGVYSGAPGQTSITIQNTAPILSTVGITPSTAYNDSTLTCTASASDPDGDSITHTYTWTGPNGNLGTGASITLLGSLAPQSSVTCNAVSSDNTDSSTLSTTVVLDNRAPVVQTPTLIPNSGLVTGVQASCSAVSTDPDNDTVMHTYEWFYNGISIGNLSSIVLPTVSAGGQLSCQVTGTDPFGAQHYATYSTTIANSPPEITTVLLSPSTPTAQTPSISCAANAVDPDNDVIHFTYEWSVDGIQQANTSSLWSGSLSYPSTITCTVTPHDAFGSGYPVSSSASVGNSAPSITNVQLAPSPAYTNTPLSVTYTLSDPGHQSNPLGDF